MPGPLVSIIVLNYNGKQYLNACLSSLEKTTYENLEVILVDNASTDGSVEFVRKKFPRVRILENKRNLGYTGANNRAARFSRGKYLLFLNNDTKVKPNLITELVSRIEADRSIGICACKQLTYDGKGFLNMGLSCDPFAWPIKPEREEDIIYSDGASLFIRKDVFVKLGGFDPKYFIFIDDVDLCWRGLLAGYKVVPVPSAIIYHMAGGTIHGGWLKGSKYETSIWRRYLTERNIFRTICKNYGFLTLLLILPAYFVLISLEIALLLLFGEIKAIKVYPRAILWNIKNARDTLQWRRKVQQLRKLSDREIMKKMVLTSSKLNVFRMIGVPTFIKDD